MSIVLARIDNRLIHGQVLEAWIPHVHADCIVVANDRIAGVTFQRVLMEAAVPRGIRVVIATVEEAAQFLAAEDRDYRVLLLFADSADALKAYRLGIVFPELNLGNMHGGEGKLRYSCTIALDREDIDRLESLEEEGVRIVTQCVPADREQYWRKLVPGGGH
jgi:PTS system mannose-specific IIB component